MKKEYLLLYIIFIFLLQACGDKQNLQAESSSNDAVIVSSEDSITTNENKKMKIIQIYDQKNEPSSENASSIYMSLGDGHAAIKGNDNTSMTVEYSVPDNQAKVYVYIDSYLVAETDEVVGTVTLDLPEEIINQQHESEDIHVVQFSQFKDNNPDVMEYLDNTLVDFEIVI